MSGHIDGLKIGMEFFYAHGARGYQKLAETEAPIFLDLKLHDIPTVAQAARWRRLPRLLNVHCGGGPEMMRAADAAAQASDQGFAAPTMLAVTVLTSLASDLHAMGINGTPRDQVLACRLARVNAVRGVCSA